mgnify:CR=1 FL=1
MSIESVENEIKLMEAYEEYIKVLKEKIDSRDETINFYMLKAQKEKDTARTWRERYFTLLNLLETTVEKEVHWSELGEELGE